MQKQGKSCTSHVQVYILVHTHQFLYEGQPRLNAFSHKNKFYQQY